MDVDKDGQDDVGDEQGSEVSDAETGGVADESSDGKTKGKKLKEKSSDCVWYAANAMSMFSKVKPDENEASKVYTCWKLLLCLGCPF